MRGKALEAESPSGNGIVLTSAETGQVGERGREGQGWDARQNWLKLFPVSCDCVRCRNTLVLGSITLS